MSHFVEIECALQDREALIAALNGEYGEGNVEVHTKPENLYGYQGDKRSQQAQIVVRQKYVNKKSSGGGSNDIGFRIEDDGKITECISKFDQGWWKKAPGDRIRQSYVEHVTMRNVPAGYKASRYVEQDGTVKITLKKQVWA